MNNSELISQYINPAPLNNWESAPNNQLTPSGIIIKKLTPYRVQYTLVGTIYEFWRVNSKNRNDIHNESVTKELAMIVINKGKTHFRLQYYPKDSSELQIMDNIPIKDLHIAVNDLIGAGFGG